MTALNGDDNDNSTPSSALMESSSAAVADSNDTIGSNYDNTIGGSISLIHESKQQSTDDWGEEMATTIQRPMGWGRRETTISLKIGRGGQWLDQWWQQRQSARRRRQQKGLWHSGGGQQVQLQEIVMRQRRRTSSSPTADARTMIHGGAIIPQRGQLTPSTVAMGGGLPA